MADLDKKATDMARAAWLYFAEELTQSQIAEKLGISRSTVIRLLQRARHSGLVSISLGVSSEIFEVERDLEIRFGLKKVRIVPDAEDDAMLRRWMGQVAAETLQEMARRDSVIAVSWGRTLRSMADALQGEVSTPGMRVVALNGGLHNADRGTNPYEVAELVSQFFDAPARVLYAPVYVRNAETAAGLISDPGLAEALDMARRAAFVVFGTGTLDDDSTMLRLGYVNATERDFLRRQGAVADIICRWIDAEGRPVALPPTINPIGISLADLKHIPDRLMLAGGDNKRDAIRACLRGGYATHLITNESIAVALLSDATQLN